MERFVLLVFTLLCIYVTFSNAEETTERKISFQQLESQPNYFPIVCPDGSTCPSSRTCCLIAAREWHCCSKRSQQVETEFKRNGFIGISGKVFSPDEAQQCPDGTRTCKLPSGIAGCCPIQSPKWISIMDTIIAPNPYSPNDADIETEDRRP